jgi:hypothetical protein
MLRQEPTRLADQLALISAAVSHAAADIELPPWRPIGHVVGRSNLVDNRHRPN